MNTRAKKEAMQTYTFEEIEQEGLSLNITDLPDQMRTMLQKRGLQDLFPVQQATYQLFAHKEKELVVKSRTGTGKTLSFLLPLEYLMKHRESYDSTSKRQAVKAIILEPTRELAIQVQDQIDKFCTLNSCLVYGGGASKSSQWRNVLQKQPELLVCTPGRLIDIIHSEGLNLSQVQYFILDEGDRMLDMGFQDDITEIQKSIKNDYCRSMIFSATVPNFIKKTAEESMTNPVMIDLVGDQENQLPDQLKCVAVLANSFQSKMEQIKQFVMKNKEKKIMIFTQTKQEARQFEGLSYANFLAIHGDLSQREREKALGAFKAKRSKGILVGTDVAARGIDVDDVDVVIQCSCQYQDSFVHRSGRTARKGKEGLNILFIEPNEMGFALSLEQKLNINIDIVNNIEAIADEGADSNLDSDEYQGTYVKRILRESNKDVKKAHMEPCKEIYNTIASDELKDEDRQQIIENLIKFYVSHTYEEEVESIGFMTCKAGATTYQIENINGAEGKSLVDDLRQRINTKAHFEFTKDRTQNQMNIIFDLDEYELQDILEGYPELREQIKKVNVLPDWAKRMKQNQNYNSRSNSVPRHQGRHVPGAYSRGSNRSGGEPWSRDGSSRGGYNRGGYSRDYDRDGGHQRGYDRGHQRRDNNSSWNSSDDGDWRNNRRSEGRYSQGGFMGKSKWDI